MRTRIVAGAVLLALAGASHAQTPDSSREIVLGSGMAASTVEVTNLSADPGRVTGILVNHSDATLREIRVRINFDWLWRNERRPGKDDPSFGVVYNVGGEIPPRGSLPFVYQSPEPPPHRNDGNFKINVTVQAFRSIRVQPGAPGEAAPAAAPMPSAPAAPPQAPAPMVEAAPVAPPPVPAAAPPPPPVAAAPPIEYVPPPAPAAPPPAPVVSAPPPAPPPVYAPPPAPIAAAPPPPPPAPAPTSRPYSPPPSMSAPPPIGY